MNTVECFDLIVCGGGIAGLCLARQLRLSGMDLSILMLERLPRPLPEAAFKVGESTIETGAFYYGKVLQLEEYLDAEQLPKLGLRYFFKGSNGNDYLAARPEYGTARFLPAKSYQLDRGKLENHLRGVVEQVGVHLKEGVLVKGIEINDHDDHTVTYQEGGELRQARARWVVDALGRRRFLQHKLGLMKESEGAFNSVWLRVKGKLTVQDFVPATDTRWHKRVKEDRWLSTNHLMGKGYWVWLIPLAPDNTSVGIVATERIHPFQQYNTYEKAVEWLEQNEPLVAHGLRGRDILDFMRLKNYSYTSRQVFSVDRWCCIGEAATFADPYYSVGSNMIAFANGFTKRFIELDREGRLTREYVDYANRFFLTLNDALTDTIHRAYPFLDNGPVLALKTIWDYYIGWTTTDPQFYHDVYLDPKLAAAVSGLISPIIVTQARMMKLFEDWAQKESSYTFEFIDYIDDQPTLTDLHKRTLPPKSDDFRRLMSNLRESVDRIEEVAQVIFLLAVRDVLPEKMHLFERRPWINTAGISLNPDRWEADGLFSPTTKPRDLTRLKEEIGRLFTLKDARQSISAVS